MANESKRLQLKPELEPESRGPEDLPPTRFTPEPKKSRAITFAVCCLIAVVVWLYSRANPIAPYVAPTPDPATVSARFTQCLLPKAQYGEYSSYDGGKSAAALLGECVGVEDEWQKSCEAAGDTDHNCFGKAMIVAQTAIKSFGK
jgi:hypothetical protein